MPLPSGGSRYALDVSWRQAEPIEVLVNPWGPEAPKMLEALAQAELERVPASQRSPGVRFQLNSAGQVWFASWHVALHGDESRGKIIYDDEQRAFLGSDAEAIVDKAVPLVYGSIAFERWGWKLDACGVHTLGLCDRWHGAPVLLNLFLSWRRAVAGTNLAPKPTE